MRERELEGVSSIEDPKLAAAERLGAADLEGDRGACAIVGPGFERAAGANVSQDEAPAGQVERHRQAVEACAGDGDLRRPDPRGRRLRLSRGERGEESDLVPGLHAGEGPVGVLDAQVVEHDAQRGAMKLEAGGDPSHAQDARPLRVCDAHVVERQQRGALAGEGEDGAPGPGAAPHLDPPAGGGEHPLDEPPEALAANDHRCPNADEGGQDRDRHAGGGRCLANRPKWPACLHRRRLVLARSVPLTVAERPPPPRTNCGLRARASGDCVGRGAPGRRPVAPALDGLLQWQHARSPQAMKQNGKSWSIGRVLAGCALVGAVMVSPSVARADEAGAPHA